MTRSLDSEPDLDEITEAINELFADKVEPADVPKRVVVPKPRARPPGRQMNREQTPAVAYVKSINPDYCTISEAAESLDVSVSTLRNWMRDPHHPTEAPSLKAQFGRMTIYVYTPEDIDALRDWMASRRGVTKRDDQ